MLLQQMNFNRFTQFEEKLLAVDPYYLIYKSKIKLFAKVITVCEILMIIFIRTF